MRCFLTLALSFLVCPFFLLFGAVFEYKEPQDVATTEGLPSSLIHQSVCTISGEYTDSIVDIVIPGPEPLTISRVYTSFSGEKPWFFNHCDRLIFGDVIYDNSAAYLIALRQPSGSQLDYIFKKTKDQNKLKKVPFQLVVPKGLTNGASTLSGKTNIKNQSLQFIPEEERVEIQSGAGNRKTFKRIAARSSEGWPLYKQVSEEKINGSQLRYKGDGKGISWTEEITCENQKTGKIYGSVKFSEKSIDKNHSIQTLTTSDGRDFSFIFKRHDYHVKEKEKGIERLHTFNRFYLSKVDHPYAPFEEYQYSEKTLSRDMHITAKLRDKGRRFLNIEYYHEGTNHLGGTIGKIEIKDKDDFRLDRVKKLEAPVGVDQTPVTIHRFDYHAVVEKNGKDNQKKVGKGYTDVYDAKNHKTRYKYDAEHRLISIICYSGTDENSYSPYTEESFLWDKKGCLSAKIFKDGKGNIHHARVFTYDSNGNVFTSTLCGKLTGKPSPSIFLNEKGEIIENGYERETKTYTYSNDKLNLLLSETDSTGKIIHYTYKEKTDLLKSKTLSYDGRIRLREFYFYDDNHALKKHILDDGCQESHQDLCYVTERHTTFIKPREEAPVGFPETSEEWVDDFLTQKSVLLKRSRYTYSPQGRLEKQQVFDAEGKEAYTLKWDYDLHGNLISETNAIGMTTTKKYDLATGNLLKQCTPGIEIRYLYDFANRLIEQKEIHSDQEFVTSKKFDHLSNCKAIINAYGHETRQLFDDFGRVIETHHPDIAKDGVLRTPIEKKSYDIAGFPVSVTDANGEVTLIEVNIRGQPTKIIYPDGTQEEMFYSLEGWLMKTIARNGTHTKYRRDPLGRITEERITGESGIKHTIYRYNAFHLIESIDPEGGITTYTYDPAGRLKETVKNEKKTEQFYDSLGRLSEVREYYGTGPKEYRAIVKKYDLLDRIKKELVQTAEGKILHYNSYKYDERGNCNFIQTGDQKTLTKYNTWNQPIKITDALGHQTHISYDTHFINEHGQKVLKKTTTDPLGHRLIEIYDTANHLVESIGLNSLGEKKSRQMYAYDLVGNQTKKEEEVIEEKEIVRTIVTLFCYNSVNQITKMTEAAGQPIEKITRILYNSFGQKEYLIKPDGKDIHYTYDAFERLKSCKSSDLSIFYLYEYNLLDQITSVQDCHSGSITLREYAQGELKKETLANGLTVDYTYDLTGRALTATYPDESALEYVYNAVDLKEIHRLKNGKRIYTHYDLTHSLSGQVTETKLPGENGRVMYQFDELDRCKTIESKCFQQNISSDGFDAAGNLLNFSMQKQNYAFSYDDHYHIQKETGHATHHYSFDSVGNRTARNGEKNQHNALNQLIKKREEALLYDLNGHLIKNGPFEYIYDDLDRLTQVTCNGKTTTYQYDAFNRRIAKIFEGEEELFLYQGQDEIGRWKQGICQEIRLIGKNQYNRTAAMEIAGIPYVPIHDIKGNITILLDLQGNIVEQYRYTAFGEREIFSPSGEKRGLSSVKNPWQYAGKRIDEESGLIAFGMRYYDPNLGRWTTPDPAGFVDGANLYAYVHNNPLLYVDRFGLFADLFFTASTTYKLFEQQSYGKFCAPLGIGQYCEEQSKQIFHFNIEDKLEERYNFRKTNTDPLFHRTTTYSVNDFINNETGQNYNFKEMPPNKMILFMNGIDNQLKDFKESLVHMGNITGYNVQGIFCPSFGKTIDAICYKNALKNGAAYEGTRELQKNMQEFHAKNDPEATMLVIPHSRGAVYTLNGLIDSPQYLRDRVDVRAIAPGAFIQSYLCKSVGHYESKRDVVPMIDFVGRWRCRDAIVTLQPHLDAPWFDHAFTSPTYVKSIKFEVTDYIKK